MASKKLILIVDGNQRGIFEVDAFEVSYGLYEEADMAVIINTVQTEVIAEGVLKPSGQGIYKEPLEDTELKNTLYFNTYEKLREAFRHKILADDLKDYAFKEKISLSTPAYAEGDVLDAIKSLVGSEETLAKLDFIKTVKEPRIVFIKGKLKITEDVEVYKKRNVIEEAKVGGS